MEGAENKVDPAAVVVVSTRREVCGAHRDGEATGASPAKRSKSRRGGGWRWTFVVESVKVSRDRSADRSADRWADRWADPWADRWADRWALTKRRGR